MPIRMLTSRIPPHPLIANLGLYALRSYHIVRLLEAACGLYPTASGCSAGAATRKASSWLQAASTALIRGQQETSTLKRRALSAWGTRYTSASVGACPTQ